MVRIAEKYDIEHIAELYYQLHKHHCEIREDYYKMPDSDYFKESIKLLLEDTCQKVIVSDDGGFVNGYAVLKISEIDNELNHKRKICYIDSFAVHEEFRSKKIGRELIKFIEEYAKNEDCDIVELGVWYENYSAVDFYSFQDFNIRTLRMEKHL